jgi:streptogramin lyase
MEVVMNVGRVLGPLFAMIIGAVAAAAGCGDYGQGSTGAGQDDALGTITLDLSVAPVNARCAVITVTPQTGTPVVRQIPLGPSQSPSFVLSGLPTGTVTVNEQVFTVVCASTTGQMPMWASDTVTVALSPGAPVSVTFNLTLVGGGSQLTVITNFPGQAPMFNTFRATTLSPLDIAPGPDGALWYTNSGSVSRLTTGGALSDFPLGNGGNPAAFGIVTGPDGNLWIAQQNGFIGRLTPSGLLTQFPVPGTNPQPVRITLGSDGNLWFTDFNNGAIGRVTPAGVFTMFPLPTPSSFPQGIAAGPDGNIWFTEGIGNKVGRISPSGSIVEFGLPTAGAGPIGITAGPDGNIWFVENSANRIGRATPAGSIVEFLIPTPNTDALEITTGPDGALWFSEVVVPQLGRITTLGTITEIPLPPPLTGCFGLTNGPDANLWFTANGNIGELLFH